jgi:hypothetical protein
MVAWRIVRQNKGLGVRASPECHEHLAARCREAAAGRGRLARGELAELGLLRRACKGPGLCCGMTGV